MKQMRQMNIEMITIIGLNCYVGLSVYLSYLFDRPDFVSSNWFL